MLQERSQPIDRFMLHHAYCAHLRLTRGEWSLTTRPRRWAAEREPLVAFGLERTGREQSHVQAACDVTAPRLRRSAQTRYGRRCKRLRPKRRAPWNSAAASRAKR